jgi:hypothetical protein
MKTIIIISFAVLIISSGCSPLSKETFYWGDYSLTLYDYKKNPDEKTIGAHKKEILEVIEYAEKWERKVPPGVYAEYGYILLKEGNGPVGMAYLDKETTLYPESTVFIERIKNMYAVGDK